MGFFKFIFQDWAFNKINTKGKIVAVFFRIANYSLTNKFWYIVLFPYRLFYKFFFEWIIGMEIPYDVSIGQGLKIYHLQAIVINKSATIGKNVTLRHSTTIGNKGNGLKCPVIGDNVNVGAGAFIIGEIYIGNNVTIGAGTVVLKDVPHDAIIVGNPGKIIINNDGQ